MNAIEEYEINNKTVRIMQDSDSDFESPRDWDNLGTLVMFHNRYNLPNETGYNHKNFDNWGQVEKAIIDDYNPCVLLPIYMYDHSEIALNTSEFSCTFDSGMVGFIFLERKKVLKEYEAKRISNKLKKKLEAHLKSEVKTYEQYLNGQVYGFVIEDEEENLVDSCWGYYDIDDMKLDIAEIMKSEGVNFK